MTGENDSFVNSCKIFILTCSLYIVETKLKGFNFFSCQAKNEGLMLWILGRNSQVNSLPKNINISIW
jgi:hypothetical protein